MSTQPSTPPVKPKHPLTQRLIGRLVDEGVIDLGSVLAKNQLLPEDPIKGAGLVNNHDRAEWAAVALDTFIKHTRTDAQSAVQDLVTDLMHLCDRSGLDFEAELERARRMYAEEAPTAPVSTAESVTKPRRALRLCRPRP